MPNGHDRKDYGPHKYADHDGTSDCEYGCGCWMGPSRSGGPVGIDPGGACPKNPVDGNLLGDEQDHKRVIEQRIHDLGQRAYVAEQKYREVEPGAKKLARELRETRAKLSKTESAISNIKRILHPPPDPFRRLSKNK